MMTNDEREYAMKTAEMVLPLRYANMPQNLKNRLHAKVETLEMSGDAFLTQLIEKTLWSRALATANLETTIVTIRERLHHLFEQSDVSPQDRRGL